MPLMKCSLNNKQTIGSNGLCENIMASRIQLSKRKEFRCGKLCKPVVSSVGWYAPLLSFIFVRNFVEVITKDVKHCFILSVDIFWIIFFSQSIKNLKIYISTQNENPPYGIWKLH